MEVSNGDLGLQAHDARGVANFLLSKSDELGFSLYPTTLLKVLYFSHGWHLALRGTPLVGQPFEAWKHGPVVRVVYDQIKEDSGKPISRRLTSFDPAKLRSCEAHSLMSSETMGLLTSVLSAYGVFHPYTLSELTHETGSPWERVWNSAARGFAPGAKLPNNEIRAYFMRQNAADVLGIS